MKMSDVLKITNVNSNELRRISALWSAHLNKEISAEDTAKLLILAEIGKDGGGFPAAAAVPEEKPKARRRGRRAKKDQDEEAAPMSEEGMEDPEPEQDPDYDRKDPTASAAIVGGDGYQKGRSWNSPPPKKTKISTKEAFLDAMQRKQGEL